ncbi:hypothetical protein ANCCAN_13773 [Ancylostoma caninum]|uniref:Uncharacterized protein n=1 Tax=Ancylostoma caninum TaxID=29170 RepID=A0A368G774_ANCCA|nr:hypothetical protein ANCCAN_13773 [Ancylostoma caninum]
MKSIVLTVGLLAIAFTAFAEEEVDNKELSETGVAVLQKIRALHKEEEEVLDAIENEKDREIIENLLQKESEAEDEIEEATRVKRAIRRRARRRGGRRAAAARRRFYRRLRRNRHRAARKRVAHARRHQRNLRRAANKIRRLQG